MEAWTILDWTNPGRLGTSKQWKGYVVKPLTLGQSASATEEERSKALVRVNTTCTPQPILMVNRQSLLQLGTNCYLGSSKGGMFCALSAGFA